MGKFCCAKCAMTTLAYGVPGFVFADYMNYTSTGIVTMTVLGILLGDVEPVREINENAENIFLFGIGYGITRTAFNSGFGVGVLAGILAMGLLPRFIGGPGPSCGKLARNPDTGEEMNYSWYRPLGSPYFPPRLGDRSRLLFGDGSVIYDRFTRYNPTTLDEKP